MAVLIALVFRCHTTVLAVAYHLHSERETIEDLYFIIHQDDIRWFLYQGS